MDEKSFWSNLEYSICHEFAWIPDKRFYRMWCDGLIPMCYLLSDSEPRITGRVWICFDQVQEDWEFTLFLPSAVNAIEEIEWASLLPPPNMTKWIAVDRDRKKIQIEPAAAVPDEQ